MTTSDAAFTIVLNHWVRAVLERRRAGIPLHNRLKLFVNASDVLRQTSSFFPYETYYHHHRLSRYSNGLRENVVHIGRYLSPAQHVYDMKVLADTLIQSYLPTFHHDKVFYEFLSDNFYDDDRAFAMLDADVYLRDTPLIRAHTEWPRALLKSKYYKSPKADKKKKSKHETQTQDILIRKKSKQDALWEDRFPQTILQMRQLTKLRY